MKSLKAKNKQINEMIRINQNIRRKQYANNHLFKIKS